MGIIRRDFGAAGLSHMVLTNGQMLVSLLTITLFVPCIAAIIMIFKERSKLEAALIWIGSFAVAFLVGGLLAKFVV
jgi:ferrous iron transport protein B